MSQLASRDLFVRRSSGGRGPGLAEGRGGHLTGFQGRAGDLLEKAVQFGLQGRLGLIEQEQGQVFEVQVAAAGEILGTLAVFGDKGGVIQ